MKDPLSLSETYSALKVKQTHAKPEGIRWATVYLFELKQNTLKKQSFLFIVTRAHTDSRGL